MNIIYIIAFVIIGLAFMPFTIYHATGQSVQCYTSRILHIIEVDGIVQCLDNRITAVENQNVTDSTTAINLGSVGEGVFSAEVIDELQFKKLLAGSGITLASNGTRITITASAGGGNASSLNDLGDVLIASIQNGQILQYDSSINAFKNINHVIFENNTASNLGVSSGLSEGIFNSKVGVDLQFKRLLEGTGILLSSNGTHITLTNSLVGDKLVGQTVVDFFQSLTLTNIGTVDKDIYIVAFDQENKAKIDFSNVTYWRIIYQWDYVGVGTHNLCWVDVANNANGLCQGGIVADKDVGDSGWIAIPSAFVNQVITIEQRGSSTTGTDDPIAKGYKIMVK